MRPRISGIFGPIVAVTLAAASLRAQPAPQPPPAPEPDAGAPVVTPPRESAVTPAPAPSQAPTPGYPAFPPPYNPYPYYPRYGYPPPTYAPPPDPRVEQRRLSTGEAHADHVILMPTAYTHPAGTVYFSSIDIVLLQAGYAISDDTQVTLSGTPPLGEDNVFPLDLSLKNAFVNEGPVRVAAIGSITGIAGLDEGNFFLGRIGGAAQLCFDTPCKSSSSVASTALLAGPATLVLTGVGFIWNVADWASLLLEVDTVVPLGNEAGEYHAIAVGPGFRLPYENWALDLGVLRPLDVQEPADIVPVITVSYRALP